MRRRCAEERFLLPPTAREHRGALLCGRNGEQRTEKAAPRLRLLRHELAEPCWILYSVYVYIYVV